MSWRTRYAKWSRGKKILAGLTAAALLWQGYRYLHRTPLMPHEQDTVKQLTQPAQTVCLGRFLLDVPQTQADKIRGTYEIDGMKIDTVQINATTQDYGVLLGKRVQEIRELQRTVEKTSRYLEMADVAPNAQTIKYFVNHAGEKIAFESWLLLQDAIVVVMLEAYEQDEDKVSDIATRLPRLQHLLTRLERLPQDGSLPKGAGFCAGQVWVKGAEEVSEVMHVSFDLPAPHDDALVRLRTDTSPSDPEGLLARMAKNAAQYAVFGFKFTTLRSGNKTINGLHGEEILFRAPTNDEGGVGQNLTWEHAVNKPSVLMPEITFEIETSNGQARTSSLTDAVAVGVYDRLLESLRLRPEKP